MAFVYWIRAPHHTNKNSEGYIGVTVRPVAERFSCHLYDSRQNSKLAVHRAIRKYGEAIVTETVIEADEEFCYLVEGMLRPRPRMGYNAAQGGDCSPTTGMKHTEEAKKRMSLKRIGSPGNLWTDARKKAWSETTAGENSAMWGKKLSEEVKKKLSKSLKGVPKSAAARENYKKAGEVRRGENHPDFGKCGFLSGRANKVVWLCAVEIHAAYAKNGGCGKDKLSTLLKGKFTRDELETITGKLKQGWNPSKDPVWVTFFNNNLEVQCA